MQRRAGEPNVLNSPERFKKPIIQSTGPGNKLMLKSKLSVHKSAVFSDAPQSSVKN